LSATTLLMLSALPAFDLTIARLVVALLLIVQGVITAAWLAGLKGSSAAQESAVCLDQRRSWLWPRVMSAIAGGLIAISTASPTGWLFAFGLIFVSELIGRVLFYAARVRQGV
jgi:DMSO reductase anchor subunit